MKEKKSVPTGAVYWLLTKYPGMIAGIAFFSGIETAITYIYNLRHSKIFLKNFLRSPIAQATLIKMATMRPNVVRKLLSSLNLIYVFFECGELLKKLVALTVTDDLAAIRKLLSYFNTVQELSDTHGKNHYVLSIFIETYINHKTCMQMLLNTINNKRLAQNAFEKYRIPDILSKHPELFRIKSQARDLLFMWENASALLQSPPLVQMLKSIGLSDAVLEHCLKNNMFLNKNPEFLKGLIEKMQPALFSTTTLTKTIYQARKNSGLLKALLAKVNLKDIISDEDNAKTLLGSLTFIMSVIQFKGATTLNELISQYENNTAVIKCVLDALARVPNKNSQWFLQCLTTLKNIFQNDEDILQKLDNLMPPKITQWPNIVRFSEMVKKSKDEQENKTENNMKLL